MQIRSFPRPDWSPLPSSDAVNIDGKVYLLNKTAVVATLRFSANASFEAHAADWDVYVMCLEGKGHTLVGTQTSAIEAGHSVLWPRGEMHQLWTEQSTMTTLMLELIYQNPPPDRPPRPAEDSS